MVLDHDPTMLHRLGFHDRDQELLEQLIVILTRVAADDEELRPVAAALLVRIERLVPDLATGAHSALEIARLVDDLEHKRWWCPEDISFPPTLQPATARQPDFFADDVARVLADL
jgi:hypothetical protein